jgi:desulfoferrodoxin (superoxide reductase-like protein)
VVDESKIKKYRSHVFLFFKIAVPKPTPLAPVYYRSQEDCMKFDQVFSRREFIKTTGMVLAAAVALPSRPALANESAVRIVAPENAVVGEEITIELHVSHEGNNLFHYTNWVRALVNGQEVRRWDYSARNRPEAENFVVTLQHTMSAPIEIVAEANCNLHGSAGNTKKRVTLA